VQRGVTVASAPHSQALGISSDAGTALLLKMKLLVSMGLAAVFFIATALGAEPAQLRQWAEQYHLDPNTVSEKYQSLIGTDWTEFARARLYFQQKNAFELLAYSINEVDKGNRLHIIDSLLAKPDYSPVVANVVIDALEKLNEAPEEQSGERNAGQNEMKSYMSTALARWLAIPRPNVSAKENRVAAHAKYVTFLAQAKQKHAMKAKVRK
jgi:hypothetical protein